MPFLRTLYITLFICLGMYADTSSTLETIGNKPDQVSKFRQLGHELPTPNIYRNASGSPGPNYWQQQVDYQIDAHLDETARRLRAKATITYHNNSPNSLPYLWLALDQNRFKNGSTARHSETAAQAGNRRDKTGKGDSLSFNALRRIQAFTDRPYGFEIQAIEHTDGTPLNYVINDTMLRMDLPEPLDSGTQVTFIIRWTHNIIDEAAIGGRGGYEHFRESDTYIFALAQWFPRLAAYTDYTGWQNKQFLGRGEFTLEFGNYDVRLSVPADHIVTATGELQNPETVLSPIQKQRLEMVNIQAPIFIVTPQEARANEATKSTDTKVWHFKANHVRDFAWSSSRKYIWDAMYFEQDDALHPRVLAMSFYPGEAEPIWSKYSTHAVIHTMDVYNRFAFNYPYPTAQSVNAWERGGMEYPMITFNGYRPEKDDKSGQITYSRNIKYGLIGVIIHEIGHIYFPMSVNSDERRWTWMDEGINTFLEYMTEYEWEENFPIRRNMQNPLDEISRYMRSQNQVPIMTQSDSILQFGPNAYAKPAAALIVLRETVMGRALFDFAFREYARRWKFKRPTPADFFRTMEDASAVDLDWFWRGWFFGTDHVDMAITHIREYKISSQNPKTEFAKDRIEDQHNYPENIVQQRNREEGRIPRIERFNDLKDFYNEHDKFTPSPKDHKAYQSFVEELKEWEKKAYRRALEEERYFYFVDFENKGGLISPLPLTIHYSDGQTQSLMIPAEIWRRNSQHATKLFVRDKPIVAIEIDRAHQTADADYNNNRYPPIIQPSRIEIYSSKAGHRNLMADMLTNLKAEDQTQAQDAKAVPLTETNDRQILTKQQQKRRRETLQRLMDRQ